ncbi:MAG: leucine-rich repeat domain-containing protein, partial [Streptococcus minor]|nr:leucine-rich repeat domain-containing protein [Streptococcus minor]
MHKKTYRLFSHILLLSSFLIFEQTPLNAQLTGLSVEVHASEVNENLQIGKTFEDSNGFSYKIISLDDGNASVQFGDGRRSIKSKLNEIRIPNTVEYAGTTFIVKEIASGAFTSFVSEFDGSLSGPSATKVIIPNTIEKIQPRAFENTEPIKSIEFEEGSRLREIGDKAFYFSNFSEFTLPDTVELIGNSAFDFNRSLRTIDISPNSQLKIIGNRAFKTNDKMQKLFIPKGVSSIGSEVLAGNQQLREVVVDPLNEFYTSEDGVLYTKNKSILLTYPAQKRSVAYDLPTEVKVVASYAFENVQGLEKLKLNEGLTTLNDFALKNIENLKEIVLPESLEEIGRLAIYIMPELEYIKIPSNVATFGKDPLYNLPSLKTIELSANSINFEGTIIGGQLDALGKIILKGTDVPIVKKVVASEHVQYEVEDSNTKERLISLGVSEEKIVLVPKMDTMENNTSTTTTTEEQTTTTTTEAETN